MVILTILVVLALRTKRFLKDPRDELVDEEKPIIGYGII